MTRPCRELGISRKTGYKILARGKQSGSIALIGRSRPFPASMPITGKPVTWRR